MSSSSDGGRNRAVLAVTAVIAVLFLLYSFLIANQILVGIVVLAFLFVPYLAYRYVRAHERIADALEVRADRTGPGDDW